MQLRKSGLWWRGLSQYRLHAKCNPGHAPLHEASLDMYLEMPTGLALMLQSNPEIFKREGGPKPQMFRAKAAPNIIALVLLFELQVYSNLLYESLLSSITEIALRVTKGCF